MITSSRIIRSSSGSSVAGPFYPCPLRPTLNPPVLRGSPSAPRIRAWSLHWNEIWQHRELLYFLTWRDIKVRYKQTVLGVTWAIVQPLAIALALTMFLGRVVHVSPQSLPYPVFAYAGMVLWQLFAQALTESSNSLLVNERLVTKIYFPRLIVPLSAVLASLLDFLI